MRTLSTASLLLLLTSLASWAAPVQFARLLEEGDALCEQNRNSEALAVYLQAQALREPDAELLHRIAKQYAQMISDPHPKSEKRKLAKTAVAYAQRAVADSPRNAQAHLTLAICYGKLAQLDSPRARIAHSRKILEEAQTAAALDPEADYAWHVLGRWHYEMATLHPTLRLAAQTLFGPIPDASLAQAVEFLERAQRTGPPRVAHHIELGRAYAAVGRPQEAREQITKGLALPSREKADEETKERGRKTLSAL